MSRERKTNAELGELLGLEPQNVWLRWFGCMECKCGADLTKHYVSYLLFLSFNILVSSSVLCKDHVPSEISAAAVAIISRSCLAGFPFCSFC